MQAPTLTSLSLSLLMTHWEPKWRLATRVDKIKHKSGAVEEPIAFASWSTGIPPSKHFSFLIAATLFLIYKERKGGSDLMTAELAGAEKAIKDDGEM